MAESFKLLPLEIEDTGSRTASAWSLIRTAAIPVVSIAVYYNVGSRNEREGRTGLRTCSNT
jgi:hypothetical protein